MILRAAAAGLRRDDGVAAPIAAILMVMLVGFAALAADVGLWYKSHRDLQAATDAAALAAVLDTAQAEARAKEYLKLNGFGPGNVTAAVSTGTYCQITRESEDGAAPAAFETREEAFQARYTPGIEDCPGDPELPEGVEKEENAVHLATAIDVPLFLSRVLLPDEDAYHINVVATAARIDEAGFYAGTGLLQLNGGIVNDVLSDLLGADVALSLAQYDGLVETDIEALAFFDALATHLDIRTGTYDSVLEFEAVVVQDVFQAAIDVLSEPGNTAELGAGALSGLATLQGQVVGSRPVKLGNMFDLGVWGNTPIGGSTAPTALDAGLNLYQLAVVALQVANGQNAISGGTGIDVLGLRLETAATVIEAPAFAFGPEGMSVHTAQVRLKLVLKLLLLEVPIYIEIAGGDATLDKIECGPNPATDATVTIEVQTYAVKVWIGQLPSDDVMPNVPDAKSTSVTFTQAEMAAGTVKSVGSDGLVGAALASGLTAGVGTLLDPLLNQLLARLGIKLGYIDVAATGVRCGVPVLVN